MFFNSSAFGNKGTAFNNCSANSSRNLQFDSLSVCKNSTNLGTYKFLFSAPINLRKKNMLVSFINNNKIIVYNIYYISYRWMVKCLHFRHPEMRNSIIPAPGL